MYSIPIYGLLMRKIHSQGLKVEKVLLMLLLGLHMLWQPWNQNFKGDNIHLLLHYLILGHNFFFIDILF